MTTWTVIVTDDLNGTLAHYGNRITRFTKCRRTGRLDGRPMRVVSLATFPENVMGVSIGELVVSDDLILSNKQKQFMEDWGGLF